MWFVVINFSANSPRCTARPNNNETKDQMHYRAVTRGRTDNFSNIFFMWLWTLTYDLWTWFIGCVDESVCRIFRSTVVQLKRYWPDTRCLKPHTPERLLYLCHRVVQSGSSCLQCVNKAIVVSIFRPWCILATM